MSDKPAATLTLSDFDYALPPELIAQEPLAERSASRLLEVGDSALVDRLFSHLGECLRRGDLLVMNDTRVFHARLLGQKPTGGKVEAMVERVVGEHEVLTQLRVSHKPAPGATLHFDGGLTATVLAREGELFRLRLEGDESALTLLERHGRLPLPPYIERAAAAADEQRYQTVFAREPGSVAAPTAGLHFDEALLADLQTRGVETAFVTLNVGAGTFQPVRSGNLAEHQMHSETYSIPAETAAAIRCARAEGRRIISVGTTTLRALESAALLTEDGLPAAGPGETALFILPGFRFRVVDSLITNFHLPRSTLLMLVSTFVGVATIRNAYAHAIARRYRFFSYGDAMLLTRNLDPQSP